MNNPQAIFPYLQSKYGISKVILRSKTRDRDVSDARQIGMFLLRHKLDLSYDKIGKVFNRTHSTVSHAYRKIAGQIKDKRLDFKDFDASDVNFHDPIIMIDASLDEALRIFKARFCRAVDMDPHGMMQDMNAVIEKRLSIDIDAGK